MRRRTPRVRLRENGYTLVEVVAVIAILGVIVVPLCATLVQALNVVPQSGQRTQTATDNSRLLSTFSADIAQAQRIETFPPAVGTGTGAVNLDTNANAIPTGTTTTFNCQTGTSPVIELTWRDRTQDLVDGFGNVILPLPLSSRATYSLVFTGVAGSSPPLYKLDLQRVSVLRGGPASTPVSYLQSVYCSSDDAVVTVNVVPANASTYNEEVSIAVKGLKDRSGKPIQMSGAAAGAGIEMHGTARVEN